MIDYPNLEKEYGELLPEKHKLEMDMWREIEENYRKRSARKLYKTKKKEEEEKQNE